MDKQRVRVPDPLTWWSNFTKEIAMERDLWPVWHRLLREVGRDFCQSYVR